MKRSDREKSVNREICLIQEEIEKLEEKLEKLVIEKIILMEERRK